MLMPVISDSYRGVRVSLGFATKHEGDMYIRFEFVGDSWKALLDRPEIDGKELANLLALGNATYYYEKDSVAHPVFIWVANLGVFDDGISMFTFLADAFKRIDSISPIARGSVIHPLVKTGFKNFLKDYSFKDTKEAYTNGSELVPMFRVLDALDMIERGKFGYCEGGSQESKQDAAPEVSEEENIPTLARSRKRKNTNKKVAKAGTRKGTK